MAKRNSVAEPGTINRWFIDVDWLQMHGRSFQTLLQNTLCPMCGDSLRSGRGKSPAAELISRIKDCCSMTPGYITMTQPVAESIFRILLAGGNHPMELMELGHRLNERAGFDSFRASPEILQRILQNDSYYGFKEAGQDQNRG